MTRGGCRVRRASELTSLPFSAFIAASASLTRFLCRLNSFAVRTISERRKSLRESFRDPASGGSWSGASGVGRLVRKMTLALGLSEQSFERDDNIFGS